MPFRYSFSIAVTILTLLAGGCAGCNGQIIAPGLIACGPAWIDPLTSPTYCGASLDCKGTNSGVTCLGGQVCRGGQCTRDNANLKELALSGAALSSPFTSTKAAYSASVSMCTATVAVTARAADLQAQIIINGGPAVHGTSSARVALASGADTITVEVVAPSGRRSLYTIDILTEGSTYIKASNTGVSDRFAVGVAISADGNTLAIGAPGEASAADNQADDSAPGAGAVYIFTRAGSTWTPQTYIKASNAGLGDAFGISVALSESGDTLAVGAFGEDSIASSINGNQADNGSQDSGAVYVFTRSGDAWTQQAYIKASNNDSEDHFGSSVALSGDTLAVGAPRESSSATGVGGAQFNNRFQRSGAVYIFTRSGASWSQQAYVKASNTGAGDAFGSSLALAASGNVLAVSAPLQDSSTSDSQVDDNGATNSGAVYIFTRSGASWAQQAYVKASNPGEYDKFGYSVSLAQTGDTLAVGAHQEESSATGINGNQADNSLTEAGAVYVFGRSGASWSQQAYIKASNTGFADNFGFSVSLAPEGDALAVGAAGEASNAAGPGADQADDSAPRSGAVYLFGRSDGTWAQRAYLKASNPGADDFFGASVALASNALLVGARHESSSATGVGGVQTNDDAPGSGAAYVYTCH